MYLTQIFNYNHNYKCPQAAFVMIEITKFELVKTYKTEQFICHTK
jgi:hypothetical protein